MVQKKRMRKPLVREDADTDDIQNMDMDAVTDSEDEYTESEKQLLKKARTRHVPENFDSDDEIYALQDGSEDEHEEQDSMESDIEKIDDDYNIPNERAWGKKRKTFYSTDYVDQDYGTVSQRDSTNAEMEGQESSRMLGRLWKLVSNADIPTVSAETALANKSDLEDFDQDSKAGLSNLSKRNQQELTDRKNVCMRLVSDFKECMTEVKDILAPFLKLFENGTCPNCDAVTFVKTKYHIILNYCINVSFYLMLQAKGSSIKAHPIMKRLAQYRELLNQLESGQGDLLEQMVAVIKAYKEGKPLYSILDSSKLQNSKTSLTPCSLGKKSIHKIEPRNEKEQLSDTMSDDSDMNENTLHMKEKYDGDDVGNENDIIQNNTNEESKRAITYQMAKNRGLTPYRKKELRNPRVKHRNKYRKAKIRRKGAVREVRKELKRYAGEISGIKASVKKGIKLK